MEPMIAVLLTLAAVLVFDILAVAFGRDTRPADPDARSQPWL